MAIPSYKSISLVTLQTILNSAEGNKLLLATGYGIITGTSVNWRELPEPEVNNLNQSGKNLAEFVLNTTDKVYSKYKDSSDYEGNAVSAIALKDVQIITSGNNVVNTSSLIVYIDQIIAASITA